MIVMIVVEGVEWSGVEWSEGGGVALTAVLPPHRCWKAGTLY